MTTQDSALNPSSDNATTSQVTTPRSTTWQRWIALIPILIVAIGIRAAYVPVLAYRGDVEHFAVWMQKIGQGGLLHFYDENLRFANRDRVYPPLSTLAFGIATPIYGPITDAKQVAADARFLALIKALPILCELLLVVAAYWWLIDRPVLRILIPALLAIHPGLIATSAWWGQYESPFVVFMVLSLMALNRNRPFLSWAMFAVAVLFKQPAIVLGPILFIITLRRYGLVKLIQSGIISGLLVLIPVIPFAVNSGFTAALSPYLHASDTFPYVSNNAYNMWFAWATIDKGSILKFEEKLYRDVLPVLPSVSQTVSRKTVGVGGFAVYVLILMGIMWRQAKEPREFIWTTAIFLGFFILPTQVHERYLYPAATLAILAAAQDSRMWALAFGLGVTYTYNILGIAIPYQTRNQDMFGTTTLALPTALLNVLLWGVCIVVMLVYRSRREINLISKPVT